MQGFPGRRCLHARPRCSLRAGTGVGEGGPVLRLPETPTTWIDFADSSVSFWRERFARPGVVIATGGLVCERDRLPELGVVDVSSYAPFLSLHEPEADEWLAARRG